MTLDGPADFHEHAYDYFFAEIYDEWYPDLTDPVNGPFPVVRSLVLKLLEGDKEQRETVKILDCACGTGNMYGAFSNEDFRKFGRAETFEIWGTDGSAAMLERARENCRIKFGGISPSKLLPKPTRWCDREGYRELKAQCGSFDFVLLNSNSFCHIPPVPEYMQVALTNFYDVLESGGRLLIDTKRYVQASTVTYRYVKGPDDVLVCDVRMFNELRYVGALDDWIVRTERPSALEDRDEHDIGETGNKAHYHTWLHYDIDPSFSEPVCRALVAVSRFGADVTPRTMVWPYYPLPAKVLARQMRDAGFGEVEVREARKDDPLQKYSYDFVIGRKTA